MTPETGEQEMLHAASSRPWMDRLSISGAATPAVNRALHASVTLCASKAIDAQPQDGARPQAGTASATARMTIFENLAASPLRIVAALRGDALPRRPDNGGDIAWIERPGA